MFFPPHQTKVQGNKNGKNKQKQTNKTNKQKQNKNKKQKQKQIGLINHWYLNQLCITFRERMLPSAKRCRR